MYLVGLGGVLSESKDGRNADGQVVTTNVEGLRVLNEAPDLLGLEMLELVVVGGTELGDHGAVMASDDNSAAASGGGLINSVLGANTTLGAASLDELVGGGVLADTSNVDYGLGGKDVLRAGNCQLSAIPKVSPWKDPHLSTASGVLGSTTGNVLGGVVGLDIVVDREVLVLGEDGIVGLQLILVKQSLVAVVCMSFFVQKASGRPYLRNSRSGLNIYTKVLGQMVCGRVESGRLVPRRGFPRQKRVYSVDILMVFGRWIGDEVISGEEGRWCWGVFEQPAACVRIFSRGHRGVKKRVGGFSPCLSHKCTKLSFSCFEIASM